MNKLLYLLLLFTCWSCTQNLPTEKHQKKRTNIINIKKQIKKIDLEEDVLIGRAAWPYIIDDYLVISDFEALDELIHIFDKNNFNYISSLGNRGEGPNEIVRIGHIEFDNIRRMFYVTDHGKQKIFSYDLDSIRNPEYVPLEKIKMNEIQFPDKYKFIHDTLAIGVIINPVGNSDFKPSIGQWNMETGEITEMKYEHSGIGRKRIVFDVSLEHSLYVEAYCFYDLITICDLNGELKCNIYGQKWNKNRNNTNEISYYNDVVFCNDKIVALYSGEKSFINDPKRGVKSNFPTKLMTFDIDGNYLNTLETEYNIIRLCYDKENNRIIMNLDDEIQFAYLDLDGIVL